MTFRQAIRALQAKGIPFRQGSGSHLVFYPPTGGIFVIPDSSKQLTVQHTTIVRKLLRGETSSKCGDRRAAS